MQVRVFSSRLMQESVCVCLCASMGKTHGFACAVFGLRVNEPIRWQLQTAVRVFQVRGPNTAITNESDLRTHTHIYTHTE